MVAVPQNTHRSAVIIREFTLWSAIQSTKPDKTARGSTLKPLLEMRLSRQVQASWPIVNMKSSRRSDQGEHLDRYRSSLHRHPACGCEVKLIAGVMGGFGTDDDGDFGVG